MRTGSWLLLLLVLGRLQVCAIDESAEDEVEAVCRPG
jgi:hypothetical protein